MIRHRLSNQSSIITKHWLLYNVSKKTNCRTIIKSACYSTDLEPSSKSPSESSLDDDKIREEKIKQMQQTIDLVKKLFSPEKAIEEEKSHIKENAEIPEKLRLSSKKPPIDEKSIRYSDPLEHATKYEKREFKNKYETNVLYWYCLSLSFSKSDFERLLPPNSRIDFDVFRSRNPKNLTRWLGYYLVFKSYADALKFRTAVEGSELHGLELKLQFASVRSPGLNSPILDKLPGHARHRCALMLGVPRNYDKEKLRRCLWDYDLLDDENLSIEYLEKDRIIYGGGPVLIRFKNDSDPYRLVREYHRRLLPDSRNLIQVEILD